MCSPPDTRPGNKRLRKAWLTLYMVFLGDIQAVDQIPCFLRNTWGEGVACFFPDLDDKIPSTAGSMSPPFLPAQWKWWKPWWVWVQQTFTKENHGILYAQYVLTLANVNLHQTIMEVNHGVLEDEFRTKCCKIECTFLSGHRSFPRVRLGEIMDNLLQVITK